MKNSTFVLRRLHSLTGIFIGLFLFNHFLTNSFILEGAEAFNHKVGFIHSIPFLLAVEIALIFVPFLFHGVYGLVIMYKGNWGDAEYSYGGNYMYVVQRWTAGIVAVFVVYHLFEWRFYYNMMLDHYRGEQFILGIEFQRVLVEKFSNPWYSGIYVIGVAAAIIHFCNGIITFCMRWGLTVGPKSKKLMIPVAVGIGLVYALLIAKAFVGLWGRVGAGVTTLSDAAGTAARAGIFF